MDLTITNCRPFTQADWDSYAGAQGAAHIGTLTVDDARCYDLLLDDEDCQLMIYEEDGSCAIFGAGSAQGWDAKRVDAALEALKLALEQGRGHAGVLLACGMKHFADVTVGSRG